jgi:glycosyltransferase involved in cell wall biosynthesis
MSFNQTVQALRIAHVITDLNGFGGTEATLLRYLQRSNNTKFNHRVVVLKSIGEGNTLGAQMVRSGIEVVELKLASGSISLRGLAQLYLALRAFKPDVISGWLYHPSLLATALAPWLTHKPAVVWNIRSLPFADLLKNTSRFVVQRLLAVLSRITRPVLVSNASAAMKAHRAIGFGRKHDRWSIIPNGLDAAQYFPDKDDALAVRRALDIPDDALLIGCVGRFVPEKGYAVMFDALASAHQKLGPEIASRLHFLAIGNGVAAENSLFMKLACRSGLKADHLHLLGKRDDVARLIRALDFFVMPSISEAFPNSLVEAMATGLACIATDVGECAEVLAHPAWIVPAGNAEQLADRMVELAGMGVESRAAMGAINRERVAGHFALDTMVDHFDALFVEATTANCVPVAN